MDTTTVTGKSRVLPLFGGESSWDPRLWIAVDDRVRGGRSTSRIERPESDKHIVFTGVLDTTALGGAGFASQATVDSHPLFPLDLSAHDAFILDIPASDGRTYTLGIKDALPPPRRSGTTSGDSSSATDAPPRQSVVVWEHPFHCPGHNGSGRVVLHFRDFQPSYRGRPKPDAEPLDWSSIKQMSLMIRSFFGKQEGAFSLGINSIVAYKYRARGDSDATDVSMFKALESRVARHTPWSRLRSCVCGSRKQGGYRDGG